VLHLFISDLHLCPSRPATTAAFQRFLAGPAHSAGTLWILGDLFEYWAGDDDLTDAFNAGIAADIRALVLSGVRVRIISGNRDFLLSQRFTRATGASIEPGTVMVEAGKTRCVLVHGDELCTDDLEYQRYRRMVRNPAWQKMVLLLPLPIRRMIAQRMRRKSENRKGMTRMALMDVNQQAVASLLREHAARCLVHGHTHRPAHHQLVVDGQTCDRWVLSDWHDKATWLELGPDGCATAHTEP